MPELPEVETLRKGLEPEASGRRIQRVEVRLAKLVQGMAAKAFSRALAGQRINRIGRRGKYLLVMLDDWVLVVHLGMTGQLTWWDHAGRDYPGFRAHPLTGLQKTPSQHAPDKHTHVLIYLEGGDRIQYRDTRQFGRLFLLKPASLESFPRLTKLGLEPLGPDFRFLAFNRALARRRGMVKPLLMSQTTVAGLGNIYADEALFLAGIRPRRRVESFSQNERRALFKAIPRVLNKGLRNSGTTFSDFQDHRGRKGRNQESLMAYGRGGLPCLRCGTVMAKIQVGQRTTVYCPRCQK